MTPIEKRKAELREYIKARENASEGPWNNCYHEKEYLIEYKLQPEGITRFAAIAGYKDNAEFITKAANESARIAEQLLECIEALEYYANGVNWYTMKENQDSISTDDCSYIIIGEDEDRVVTSKCGGKTARKLLNKIAGEK